MSNESSRTDAKASDSQEDLELAKIKLHDASATATPPPAADKKTSVVEMATEVVTASKAFGKMLSFKKRHQAQKKPKAKMLTSAQISDLFRRLDRDGNGELDLEEFLQVSKKLKLEASEEYITGIFREVDRSKSGTVDIAEFTVAYQKLFTGTAKTNVAQTGEEKATVTEVVTAVRYGIDDKGKHVFEIYSGYVEASSGFQNFIINEKRVYRDKDDAEPANDFDVVPNFSVNLVGLNNLINEDSKRNKETNANVYWWVDIAMVNVVPYRVDKYIAGFGLPNDTKFRANFGLFNNILPKAEKSHMYPGNGSSDLGTVSSLTMFAQTLWVRNIPLVHCTPEWMNVAANKVFGNEWANAINEYYHKRFAFFFTTVWSSDKWEQYSAAYNDAEFLSQRLLDPDMDINVHEIETVSKDWNPLERVSVAQIGAGHSQEPDWLLPSSEIASRPTKIVFDTISMTLLNNQYGTCACLTIRQIENEGKGDLTLSAQSRLGVLGRIVTGVRMKIFENVRSKGLTSTAGRVTDSPSALVSVLTNTIHNFSMNSLGSLNSWIRVVENETEDLVVSKHYSHAKEIGKLVKMLKEYVAPTHDVLESLDAQTVNSLIQNAASSSQSTLQQAVSSSKNATELRGNLIRNETLLSTTDPILPHEKLSGPLTHELISPFTGKGDLQNAHTFLEELLEGDATLELKGTKYWKEQINELIEKLERLREDMNAGLEEKRSFYSFLLTIVTVFLAPLAILTGYWGMNFDNMVELDHTTYPAAPGIHLMWITAGTCYGMFLLLGVHYRIIYSAT